VRSVLAHIYSIQVLVRACVCVGVSAFFPRTHTHTHSVERMTRSHVVLFVDVGGVRRRWWVRAGARLALGPSLRVAVAVAEDDRVHDLGSDERHWREKIGRM
jgi:hypothetical protein